MTEQQGGAEDVPRTAHADDAARRIERWFRGLGLPAFVRRGRRGRGLVGRTAPFLVFLLVLAGLTSGIAHLEFEVEVASPGAAWWAITLVLLLGVLGVAVPIAAGVATAHVLQRYPRAALPVGAAVTGAYVVLVPIAVAVARGPEAAWLTLVPHVVGVLVALLLTRIGAGSLLASAARTALRQSAAIGALVSRALPILMLVIVFAFFSRPVWEVTSTMSPPRLLAVAVFFAVLGLLFVLPITRTEMRSLETAEDAGPPLSRLERANLHSGLVVALVLQTVLFSAIVCGILVLLGALALSTEVLEEWVGPRLTEIDLFGVEVPFTWALLKTAFFLSCVSSLNFLVSVTTNAAYRDAFFHPLVDGARTALGVRAAYLRGETDVVLPSRVVRPRPAGATVTAAGTGAGSDDDDSAELPMVEPGPGTAG